MAENKQTESVEKRLSRTDNVKDYTQVVMVGTPRIFVERYLTKKGKRLMAVAKTKADKDLIHKIYGKNRYRPNPDYKPFHNPDGTYRRIKHT